MTLNVHAGPEPTIKQSFLRFHRENPHVYDELLRLTKAGVDVGATRLGMKMLFEVLRWNHTLRTRGEEFKLSNNFHSYYARLIMRKNPEYDGIFQLKPLHGPDLTEEEVHAAYPWY